MDASAPRFRRLPSILLGAGPVLLGLSVLVYTGLIWGPGDDPVLIGDGGTGGRIGFVMLVAGYAATAVGAVWSIARWGGRGRRREVPAAIAAHALGIGACFGLVPVMWMGMFSWYDEYVVLHSDATHRDLVVWERSLIDVTYTGLYERDGIRLHEVLALPDGDGSEPALHGDWTLRRSGADLVLRIADREWVVPPG